MTRREWMAARVLVVVACAGVWMAALATGQHHAAPVTYAPVAAHAPARHAAVQGIVSGPLQAKPRAAKHHLRLYALRRILHPRVLRRPWWMRRTFRNRDGGGFRFRFHPLWWIGL